MSGVALLPDPEREDSRALRRVEDVNHDTPHETTDQLRWCDDCQMNVEPSEGERLTCPSCGGDLG
jgi:hypothetical protein